MDQPGIHQPLQGVLIFPRPGALFDDFIEEFLVLAGQLRGDGLPDHRNFGERAGVGMLGKIPFVSVHDVGERLLHGLDVPCLGPHEDGFRHPTGHIVHLEFFIERVEKSVRKRVQRVDLLQILRQVLVAVGQQKLSERHGVDLHEIDLAHRERRGVGQRDAQQGTGAGHVILRRVLAKIFHGVDDLGAVLHLVKNDQRLFRVDRLPAGQHQVLQNAVHVLRRLEKLLIFLLLIEVKIGDVFIVPPAKFL